MLKKSAIKKIIISSLALLIVSITYVFPDSAKRNAIQKETIYQDVMKTNIYIPLDNNYVARTEVISKEKDLIKKIEEIISYLTIDSEKKDYLSDYIIPIIPKNTKILNIDLDNLILKIDFSKELLNIDESLSRKLIESIVFSLTEFKEVDKIMIFVEGIKLNKYPNTNISLPNLLDRSIGINMVYDIDDYHSTSLITTYYVAKNNDFYYYVPISKITNNNKEKVEIIIDELKSMPIYETNLMSYLNSNVKLLDYEILENQIKMSFNTYILDDIIKKNILEEVKYSIYLSIKDTYNINSVTYIVDNETIFNMTI